MTRSALRANVLDYLEAHDDVDDDEPMPKWLVHRAIYALTGKKDHRYLDVQDGPTLGELRAVLLKELRDRGVLDDDVDTDCVDREFTETELGALKEALEDAQQ